MISASTQRALITLFALPSLIIAAERSGIETLRQSHGAEFEAAARETLSAFAAKAPSLPDLAAIHGIITNNSSFELQQIASRTVRDILAAPDLATRYTLRDGVALWAAITRAMPAREFQNMSAEAIHRIASAMDEAALREAFLKVSPVLHPELREMNAEQIKEADLNRLQRQMLFWLLSERWIEREVAALRRADDGRFRCPQFEEPPPPEVFSELPPECVPSWMEAARLRAWTVAQRPKTPASDDPRLKREFSDVGAPNFEAIVDRFFQDPRSVAFAELSRFYWTSGFWCGTGGEGFESARARMELMMLLRDGQVPQALRMMLAEGRSQNDFPASWREGANWRVDLLAICGLDWEKLLSSALLPYSPSSDRGRVGCGYAGAMLAARGSALAARLLLALGKQALAPGAGDRLPSQFERLGLIASFITPGDIPQGTRPEVAPEVQKELLQLLVDSVQRNKSFIAQANSLRGLGRLQRPEIKEALRLLLQSPFDYVVQKATAELRTMGEVAPPSPVRSKPRFRVFLNDKPWPWAAQAFGHIHFETKAAGWGINNHLSLQGSQTDELTSERDSFLEAAAQMTQARVVIRPMPGESSLPETSLDQPWFAVPLSVPVSLDAINEMRATTHPLPVQVAFPRPIEEYAGQTLDLELKWLDDPSREDPTASMFRVPARASYTFAALQPGRYRLAVTATGAARKESGIIQVKKGMPAVKILLGPASAVRAKIIPPDFAPSDQVAHIAIRALQPERWRGSVAIAKLLKDGSEVEDARADFDAENGIVSFSNIPPGTYQLRVPGPQDFIKEQGGRLLQAENGEPANAAWERAEITFKVRADSPVLIDAGEVRLKKTRLPESPSRH